MICDKNEILLFSKKEECCGCGACYGSCESKAIIMKEDKEGFLYPEINNELCLKCRKCIDVCPNNKLGDKYAKK